MSTFASSIPGLIPIQTPAGERYRNEALNASASGWVRHLAERIGRDLVSNAHAVSPRGATERDLWTGRAGVALSLLSLRPFCRLREVAEACHCNYDEAITLLATIRRNRETEMFLTKYSGDAPYRRSTIQPIIESGALKAFLEGHYRYPYTVGIYPGTSGGDPYRKKNIVPGNELFRRLLAEAPRDLPRRFYLSGGQEPLTNPDLAALVGFAAEYGHRMTLYTDGMMLTPRFLSRNEKLWRLDTLCLSLQGAQGATARRTASQCGAATQVIANAKSLVRWKTGRGSTMRVGLHHVVKSGQISQLRNVARAVVAIASHSGERRGINFLTLRENHAASGETTIRGEEREQLRDELMELKSFFLAEGMKELEIDLDNSMQGLVDGLETVPVRRVTHREILGRGYPQISVVVDLLGDVYLYREAAFSERAGAERYIIGRLTPEIGLAELLQRYIADKGRFVTPGAGDEVFLDAFDHAVTAFLRQASDDLHFGSDLSGVSVPTTSYRFPANLWR